MLPQSKARPTGPPPRSRSPPGRAPAEDEPRFPREPGSLELAAIRWRDKAVAAVEWRLWMQLPGLAREALRLGMTREILAVTGVGFLAADRALWSQSSDPGTFALMEGVVTKWKALSPDMGTGGKGVPHPCYSGGVFRVSPNRPLAGLKSAVFIERVDAIEDQLADYNPDTGEAGRREAAIQMIYRQVSTVQDLEVMAPEEVATWSFKPTVARVLAHSCQVARIRAQRREARVQEEAGLGDHYECPRLGATPVSAGTQANALALCDVPASLAALERQHERAGIPGLGVTVAPSKAPAMLARAEAAGIYVQRELEERARLLQIASRKDSLKSAASALRAWHGFATLVLGYGEGATLPPRSVQDALLWGAIFKNSGTAANYLSFVKWACTLEGLDITWYGPRVSMLLKGFKKVALQDVAQKLETRLLMTETLMHEVNTVAESLEGFLFPAMSSLSWSLLSRVQSEILPLELGSPADLEVLPMGRHSAVVISPDERSVAIRLRRRKNKPQGSVLVRKCICTRSATSLICPVHMLVAHVKGMHIEPGQKLFPGVTPAIALRMYHRFLTLVGQPKAKKYTFKSFRAGKASAMAGEGFTLGQILEAGEWRSRAVFNYLDVDAIDAAEVLRQTIDHSDVEDAAEETEEMD